jgi:hypothetical protein
MFYYPDYQDEFEKLEQQLVKLYNLRQIGDVKWFLGIHVERLLASRQLYLVQDAFISKVCTEFELICTDNNYPSTTLVRRWYYYRGRYCKTTKVEEQSGCRLVLR